MIAEPQTNRRNKECLGNNAKFTYDYRTPKANIVSTKRILPHHEICVGYGRCYWRKKN